MTALLAILAILPSMFLLVMLVFRHRDTLQLEKQHQALVEQLSEGVLWVGRDGLIRQYNSAARQLLAPGIVNLLDSRLTDWLPAFFNAPIETRQQVLSIAADGRQRWLEVTRLGESTAQGSLLLIRPVVAEAERYQRSQYFARIGTWDWDIDTNRLYWSDAIYGLFGYQVGQVMPSYELFCTSVHPDDREHVRAGEVRCIETGENHDEEYRVIWPDGSVRWLRETGNVIKDVDGTPVKMMGVVRDITEEKAWASQMHQLAHHDALTGLPNRLVFESKLRAALERARRSEARVALVFIDLNDFKAINDKLGHGAGDQVLVATATRLRAALRESDGVARIGGDEFVAILEGLPTHADPEDEARGICEKLLDALAAPVQIGATLQPIHASLGIAVFPDDAPNMDRLIHLADLAMYTAKRSGNNQYRLGRESARPAAAE